MLRLSTISAVFLLTLSLLLQNTCPFNIVAMSTFVHTSKQHCCMKSPSATTQAPSSRDSDERDIEDKVRPLQVLNLLATDKTTLISCPECETGCEAADVRFNDINRAPPETPPRLAFIIS
jgi:hypothetical protein